MHIYIIVKEIYNLQQLQGIEILSAYTNIDKAKEEIVKIRDTKQESDDDNISMLYTIHTVPLHTNFPIKELRSAKARLDNRDLFKPGTNTQREYEEFIVSSLTERRDD